MTNTAIKHNEVLDLLNKRKEAFIIKKKFLKV